MLKAVKSNFFSKDKTSVEWDIRLNVHVFILLNTCAENSNFIASICKSQ